jgi:hypothetical protein
VPAEGPKIKVVARVWSWGQTASGRVLCRIAKADSGLSSPHRRRFPTTNSNPFTGSAPEQKSVRLRMLVKTRHAGPFRSEVANIAFVLNDNFSSPGRIIAALHLRIAVPIWGRRPASTQVLRKPLSSSGNGVRQRGQGTIYEIASVAFAPPVADAWIRTPGREPPPTRGRPERGGAL